MTQPTREHVIRLDHGVNVTLTAEGPAHLVHIRTLHAGLILERLSPEAARAMRNYLCRTLDQPRAEQ